VISARNAGASIGPSLRSSLEALGPDDEIIAVDDGSTDDTQVRMREVLQGTRHTLLTTAGVGLTRALRQATAVARGAFIARLDAGDTMTPDRIRLHARAFEADPRLVACGGNVRYRALNGTVLGQSAFPTTNVGIKICLLARSSPFVHSTLSLRTSALLAAGGYREFFECAQDFDLVLRLSRMGTMSNLAEVVCDFEFGQVGISFNRALEQFAFGDVAWHHHLLSLAGRTPELPAKVPPVDGWRRVRAVRARQWRTRASAARAQGDLRQAWLLEMACRMCFPVPAAVGALVRGTEKALRAASPGE
jgi:glycosyltransferase involved in cell wall biosynthesis